MYGDPRTVSREDAGGPQSHIVRMTSGLPTVCYCVDRCPSLAKGPCHAEHPDRAGSGSVLLAAPMREEAKSAVQLCRDLNLPALPGLSVLHIRPRRGRNRRPR